MCGTTSRFFFLGQKLGPSLPTSQKRRGRLALVITIRRRSGNSSSMSLAWTLVTWMKDPKFYQTRGLQWVAKVKAKSDPHI